MMLTIEALSGWWAYQLFSAIVVIYAAMRWLFFLLPERRILSKFKDPTLCLFENVMYPIAYDKLLFTGPGTVTAICTLPYPHRDMERYTEQYAKDSGNFFSRFSEVEIKAIHRLLNRGVLTNNPGNFPYASYLTHVYLL